MLMQNRVQALQPRIRCMMHISVVSNEIDGAPIHYGEKASLTLAHKTVAQQHDEQRKF